MGRQRRVAARLEGDGEVLAYDWVRVAGRRHLHVVVRDGRLEVRTPWRCTAGEARAALEAHRDWARERLARERARRTLGDGRALPLLDETLRLCLARPPTAAGDGGRCGARGGEPFTLLAMAPVRRAGDELHVLAAPGESLEALLGAWYRGEAERLLPGRVAALAERAGLWPRQVRIGAQRRRWGSCSVRGTLRLSWRVLQLPAALADYVIAHELCHLAHLDHSPRFWARVAEVLPDYRERRARLRAIEGELPL